MKCLVSAPAFHARNVGSNPAGVRYPKSLLANYDRKFHWTLLVTIEPAIIVAFGNAPQNNWGEENQKGDTGAVTQMGVRFRDEILTEAS